MNFKKITKGIWTLALLTALGIGSYSCTSAQKKVHVSPSKPAVQLEYKVDESFAEIKSLAEIKELGNPQSDKIVYYIPQVHVDNSSDYPDIYLDIIFDCQVDIFNVIRNLNKNHGVGLLALEGRVGEVNYKGLLKSTRYMLIEMKEKYPDMTKKEANHRMQTGYALEAGAKYEMIAENDILTIGVDDQELNEKAIALLKDCEKLLEQLYDFSVERSEGNYRSLKNKYLRNLERFEAYGVKGRSDTAVSKLLESMQKYNMKSSILIYGGGHTDTIVDAFGDKVKLYVIELNSYKNINNMLDGLEISDTNKRIEKAREEFNNLNEYNNRKRGSGKKHRELDRLNERRRSGEINILF